jgi:glutathione S-transferase
LQIKSSQAEAVMKLYYAPEFSSLADHIAMIEAGIPVELVEVDLASKQIAGGGDFRQINEKGYVPALVFDDGQVLTENAAILAWVADAAPHLAPPGPLGRYRLIEMLSFIASELHKRFPIYMSAGPDMQASVGADISRWLDFAARRLEQGYLFGANVSVADFYLFVMARGARELGFPLPEPVGDFIARISARPSVKEALRREAGVSGSGTEGLG